MKDDYCPEVKRIVDDIRQNSEYRDYVFDRDVGLFRGPYSGSEVGQIPDNEAIIGMKQQITRMAQRHTLLVEKSDSGKWQLKKVLLRTEG
jgi:hypothetical protein